MLTRISIFLFLIIFTIPVIAEDTKPILHDSCINALYMPASVYFMYDNIHILRDSRGIIIRFQIEDPVAEYKALSQTTIQKIAKIESFLAKIKNLAIIEVHIGEIIPANIKNWEISAVIAGNIERIVCTNNRELKERIYSVGYGEFLPAKNTPNNGGNFLNRVDIIVLCNISGE